MHKSQFTDPARAQSAGGSEKSGERHASPDPLRRLRRNWNLVSIGIGYYIEKEFSSTASLIVLLALFFSNFVVS
jgi:hypothetical protein